MAVPLFLTMRIYKFILALSAVFAVIVFLFLLIVPKVYGDNRLILHIMEAACVLWIAFSLFEFSTRLPLFFRLPRKWRIFLLSLVGAGLLGSLSLECLILSFSAPHELSEKADVILVLGGGLNGDKPSGSLEYRLDTAVELAKKEPHLPVVVTGGMGKGETVAETVVMKEYLVRRGISADRIYQEGRAGTTRENFRFSRRLFPWKNPEHPCAYVVTNRSHEYRACMTGRDGGWECIPWSAPDYPWLWPILHPREQLAILKHWFHPARYAKD